MATRITGVSSKKDVKKIANTIYVISMLLVVGVRAVSCLSRGRLGTLSAIPEWDSLVEEFYSQPPRAASVLNARPPISIPCSSDCGREEMRGSCDWLTGECRCTVGWKGETCDDVDDFPCNNPDGKWTVTHCFAECRRGQCFCGPGTVHPDRPLMESGHREVTDAIYAAIRDNDTTLLSRWGIHVRAVEELDLEWLRERDVTRRDVDAWCSADDASAFYEQDTFKFGCWLPEQIGPLCDMRVPSVCINQCSGKGFCDRGFCVCEPGHHGVDCSIPVGEDTTLLVAMEKKGSGGLFPVEAEEVQGAGGAVPGHKGSGMLPVEAEEVSSRSLSSSSSLSSQSLPSVSSLESPPGPPPPPSISPALMKQMARKELRRQAKLRERAHAQLGSAVSQPSSYRIVSVDNNGNDIPSKGSILTAGTAVPNDETSGGLPGSAAGSAYNGADANNSADDSSDSGSNTISNTHDSEGRREKKRGGSASISKTISGGTSRNDASSRTTTPSAKRPCIYVYELPPVFNSRLLQFRRPDICTTRSFTPSPSGPKLQFQEWLYDFDFLFLEWLLQSDHRTLDPDEADYFYVPFLMSCYIFLADDFPRHRLMDGGYNVIAASQAVKLILQHIRGHYPHWDRRNGTDHIWTWTWDEGSAGAPAVIRNSVLLTSWGARYVAPRTAYLGSLYIREQNYQHDTWLFGMAFQDVPLSFFAPGTKFNSRGVTWAGDVEERGDAPGYDPEKDIVFPAPYYSWLNSDHSLYHRWLRGPEAYELGERPCPTSDCQKYNHDFLFYFAGDLGEQAHQRAGVPEGRPQENYSWGLRQTLARHYLGEEGRAQGIYLVPGHSEVSQHVLIGLFMLRYRMYYTNRSGRACSFLYHQLSFSFGRCFTHMGMRVYMDMSGWLCRFIKFASHTYVFHAVGSKTDAVIAPHVDCFSVSFLCPVFLSTCNCLCTILYSSSYSLSVG
eukprot:jgi/Mesvir1/12789/Mv22840-RA.2